MVQTSKDGGYLLDKCFVCGNDSNCVYFAQFANNVTNVTINKGQSLSYLLE